MTDLLSSSQFWLLVSIGFYALGVEIQKKTGSAVCNPLLIASILVGALLICRSGRHGRPRSALVRRQLMVAVTLAGVPGGLSNPARSRLRLCCLQRWFWSKPVLMASHAPTTRFMTIRARRT